MKLKILGEGDFVTKERHHTILVQLSNGFDWDDYVTDFENTDYIVLDLEYVITNKE